MSCSSIGEHGARDSANRIARVAHAEHLRVDRARSRKFASRQKTLITGSRALVHELQLLIASGENAYRYGELASGAYQDKETNLAYNYFGEYVPGIVDTAKSDPVGRT